MPKTAALLLSALVLFQSVHPGLGQDRSVESGGGNVLGTSAPTSELRSSSASIYALTEGGTGLSSLAVGRPVGWDTFLVILRPSPGDDYWYRLPHTIEVRGALPEGIELVQKGPGFHQLACFKGTPTKAGVYPIVLQATMADGIKTAELSLTLTVANPADDSNAMLFTYGRTRFLAGEMLQQPCLAVYFPSGAGGVPRQEGSGLKVTGLPPGLSVVESGESGSNLMFEIEGIPLNTGVYPVAFEWVSSGNVVVARAERGFEVLPANVTVSKSLTVSPGVGIRPLRQFEKIWQGTPGVPMFNLTDSLGRSVDSGFKVVAEGLPKGLSIGSGFPAFEGTAQQSGQFNVRFKAVFDEGGETEWQSVELQIEASNWSAIRSAAAGVYDCLIERSEELNQNNGGRLFVTVTASGALSGYVINGFGRFPFSARDAAIEEQSGKLSIRPPGSGLLFEGEIQEDDQGYSTPNRKVFVLIGTLQTETGAGFVSICGMQATRRVGSARSPYGAALPINLMVMEGDIFSMAAEVGDAPIGISFMTVRVSNAGIVTATVWPADGSAPASTSTRLSETESNGARFNLHFGLVNSSGRNSMLAQMFVNLDGDAAGLLSWYQNASARGMFPEGIPLIQYGGVIGSRDVPAKTGLNLEGFEKGIANAELELLRSENETDAVQLLTIDDKSISVARVEAPRLPAGAAAAAAPSPSITGMKMRYDARSGMVTGSGRLKPQDGGPARTINFRGMRAPGGEFLAGHYVLSGVGRTVPPVAGQMRITPSNSGR